MIGVSPDLQRRPRRAPVRDPLRALPERGERDVDAAPQHAARTALPDAPARVVPARHGRGRGRCALERPNVALPSRDFTIRSSTTRPLRRVGASPTNMTIQDWGITYDELEPYYDKFEYMAGIAGKAGNLKGKQIAGRERLRGAALARVPGQAAARHRDRVRSSGTRRLSSATTRSRTVGEPAVQPTRTRTAWSAAPAPIAASASASAARSGAKADPTVTVLPVALQDRQVRDAHRRLGVRSSRTTARSAQSILYYDAMGASAGAACRRHRARRLRVQQRAPAAASRSSASLRPRIEQRRRWARTTRTRQAAAGRPGSSTDLTFEPLHGCRRPAVAIDDFNADNFDHTRPRLHRRRIDRGRLRAARGRSRACRPAPGTPALGRGLEGGDSTELQERVDQRRLPGRVARLPVPLPRP